MLQYGITILEETISPPSVRQADASTIFVLGSLAEKSGTDTILKDGADPQGIFGNADKTAIDWDKPTLLGKRGDAPTADLGKVGTLPLALDAIFAQGNFKVVMVPIPHSWVSGRDPKPVETLTTQEYHTTLSGSDWQVTDGTGANSGSKVLKFGSVLNAGAGDGQILSGLWSGRKIHVYDAAGTTLVKTFEVTGNVVISTKEIPVNSNANADGLVNNTNYTLKTDLFDGETDRAALETRALANASDLKGLSAALAVKPELGVKPRLLCAPGIPNIVAANYGSNPTKNGVADRLVTLGEHLRAIGFVGFVPSVAADDTNGNAKKFAGAFDSDRLVVVTPGAKMNNADAKLVDTDLTGFYVGAAARTDYEKGWWNSFSNKPVRALLGLSRPIDFGYPSSAGQDLIDGKLWSVDRSVGGFQTAGEVSTTVTDPASEFPNVRRTIDIIADSLEQSFQWAKAESITKNFYQTVAEGVNNFLRELRARDAIIYGNCYPDPDLNTASVISKGQAWFNVEVTPVYPANRLVFKLQLSKEGLAELAA